MFWEQFQTFRNPSTNRRLSASDQPTKEIVLSLHPYSQGQIQFLLWKAVEESGKPIHLVICAFYLIEVDCCKISYLLKTWELIILPNLYTQMDTNTPKIHDVQFTYIFAISSQLYMFFTLKVLHVAVDIVVHFYGTMTFSEHEHNYQLSNPFHIGNHYVNLHFK